MVGCLAGGVVLVRLSFCDGDDANRQCIDKIHSNGSFSLSLQEHLIVTVPSVHKERDSFRERAQQRVMKIC